MNCKFYRTELIGFLRGELPPAKETLIREHLERCPGCRSFAEYLKSILEIISTEKKITIAPDPFLATRIEGRLLTNPAGAGQKTFVPKLIPALVFSFFIIAGIFGGIGVGELISSGQPDSINETGDISLLMDDLRHEPIEGFLLGY